MMSEYPYPRRPPTGTDSLDTLNGSPQYPLDPPPNLHEDSAASLHTTPFLNNEPRSDTNLFNSKEESSVRPGSSSKRPFYKRPWIWLLAVVLVGGVVAIIVVFTVVKPTQHKSNTKSAASSPANNAGADNPNVTTTESGVQIGGDGSTVTTDDGSTFVYHNPFGGFCACFPSFYARRLPPPFPRAS